MKQLLPKLLIATILLSIIILPSIIYIGKSAEIQELQIKIDSLNATIDSVESKYKIEKIKLIYLSKADSIQIKLLKEDAIQDNILILKQKKAINKYTKLNNIQLLDAIDSAYEANK